MAAKNEFPSKWIFKDLLSIATIIIGTMKNIVKGICEMDV